MNDMLGRPILKGDTLAYAAGDRFPLLKTAEVTGVSAFALQLTPPITGDGEPKPFVVSKTDQFVIGANI
jgi:hypothetical protein